MYDYCLVYYLPFYSSNQSSTPFKKVTQHDFDRLYFFYPGFLFTKIDIPRKPVYLPFDWCLICWDCFTGARAGWVNWGQHQKGKVAKLIGLNGKCMLCQVLGFRFVTVCTRNHCPFIASNPLGRLAAQWMGSGYSNDVYSNDGVTLNGTMN